MISLSYNAVPSSARKSILEVFDSGQFSPGPKVKEFEKRFAGLHGAKHAVFVNSGTDALRLSLLALKEKLGWFDGDLVAVPSLTFVATINVVLQCGLRPLFVDVHPTSYCMNPLQLEERIKSCWNVPVVAVMPVHLFGQSCHPDIYKVAKKYSLKVIEDSCETILNPMRGDISCHSSYMAHHLSTGVGGLALINNEELAMLIRSFANHGRSVAYIPGHTSAALSKYLLKARFRFDRLGYSSRGTEFEAVLGMSQLKDLEKNIDRRQAIAEALCIELSMTVRDEMILPSSPRHGLNTWMMFPIVIKAESKIDKYALCFHLEKAGIETREMMPITNQPCFRDSVIEDKFPVAKWINRCGFYIPCHPGMTQKDIGHIGKTFKSYFK